MFTKSADLYDAIYAFKDYAKEAELLHDRIRRHKRSPGSRLLDVACGTGGHIPFLSRQYQVEGIDLDPAMIAAARQRHPGVPFHEGDMLCFGLGRRFDVVTCLFSSIGYAKTTENLVKAVRNVAGHLEPGGVLIVEPWLTPEAYTPGRVYAIFVDQPELKIARMNISEMRGGLSVFDFHYLVARPSGIEHFVERHELGLFSHEEYLAAFEAAGLEVTHDPRGLTDRGLYIGVRPTAT